MARIRYIKPEFFDSEQVASVSLGARLLFAGLWTVADREGRFDVEPDFDQEIQAMSRLIQQISCNLLFFFVQPKAI